MTIADSDHTAPLLTAVGRLVLAGAALEDVLRVGILMRAVNREGTVREEVGRELTELEGRGAGKALKRLRELGIPQELGDRILEVIQGRNRVVHHLMRQPGVELAL